MAHPPLWSLRDGSTAQTVAQCWPTLIISNQEKVAGRGADVRPGDSCQQPRKGACFKGFWQILPRALRLPLALRHLDKADALKGSSPGVEGWLPSGTALAARPAFVEIETRSGSSPPRLLSSARFTERQYAADERAVPVGIWPLVCQGIRPSRELSSRRSATGGRCTGSVPACRPREGFASSSAAASRGAGVSHPRQCGEAQVPTPPLRGLSGREGGAAGRWG